MSETALESLQRCPRLRPWTAGLAPAVLFSFVSAALAQTAASDAGSAAGVEFEKGRQQFHRICAQCHGRNMINSGVTVYDLRRFPLDQPERFFSSVMNGKGNMPSFQDALDAEQLRRLWAYVSSRGQPPQ